MPIQEIDNKKMPSLTEWLEKIGYEQVNEFRQEDNTKRDRLEILFEETGLPYDRPERMEALDIENNTPLFQDIVKRKGEKLCALRLVPKIPDLPKLRSRGKTLNHYLATWYKEQKINPKDYKVEVVPHPNGLLYSANFIIDENGIWGEIVPGWHWQLSQGLHDHEVNSFFYNWNTFEINTESKEIENLLKEIFEFLKIDPEKQEILKNKINSEFTANNYLKGYFEYTQWLDGEHIFIDYNQTIFEMLKNFQPKINSKNQKLVGTPVSPGIAKGKAKIITDPKINNLEEGEILITQMTMVDYLPFMQRAGAIITEQGGLLSHAAIVSRELKKPCIVGVKNAMQLLKNGDEIEVDANQGMIKIL